LILKKNKKVGTNTNMSITSKNEYKINILYSLNIGMGIKMYIFFKNEYKIIKLIFTHLDCDS